MAIIAVATITIRWNSPPVELKYAKSLEFASGRDDSTYLVSDGPGYLAYFRSSSRIVAADMLTGNVSVIQEMQDSGNAIRYLFDRASGLDKPIGYIIFMGGRWLTPSPSLECVIYNDPLHYPYPHQMGQVHLGPPIETALNNEFIVWDASSPRFDVPADDPICHWEGEG